MKDNGPKDISAEYVTKFFHEDAMMSGFLHVKIQRIRNIMRLWKSTSGNQDEGNPEEKDVNL